MKTLELSKKQLLIVYRSLLTCANANDPVVGELVGRVEQMLLDELVGSDMSKFRTWYSSNEEKVRKMIEESSVSSDDNDSIIVGTD